MKRFLAVFLVLMLLVLSGCGKTAEKSLYDRGLEVVDLMAQAVRSEEYISALSASDALTEKIQEIAEGDYETPAAVYEITFPESSAAEFLDLAAVEGLPASLSDVLNHRLMAAVTSQINAMAGVESLAVSSLCTIGKTFVSSETTKDTIYLYTYESGFPVSVTFTVGEDHTVSASGVFQLYEDLPTGSPEELEAFFSGYAEVEKIA